MAHKPYTAITIAQDFHLWHICWEWLYLFFIDFSLYDWVASSFFLSNNKPCSVDHNRTCFIVIISIGHFLLIELFTVVDMLCAQCGNRFHYKITKIFITTYPLKFLLCFNDNWTTKIPINWCFSTNFHLLTMSFTIYMRISYQ